MKNIKTFVSSLFLTFIFTHIAFAGTATLSWNANTETDLAGYKIYYGTLPRTNSCPLGGYPNNINAGNVTSYVFSNLTDGQTYYFSITAYDASSNESCFSSEVSKYIPVPNIYISNVKFIPVIESATSISGKNFTITIFNAGTTTQVAQFTTQLDQSGNLVMPASINIESGVYDILTYSPTYLKKKKNNTVLSSNSITSLPTLPAGDLNNDNTINSLDWSLMSPKWFSQDAIADINGDNIINAIDYSFLNKNWWLAGD
ncbi:MAG: fibronectin type III domain-containing protein [Parcubacteria group bacterium]|nr:fibronectin type III domain-containing protein [Parcubacteria group bacterium]